VPRQARPVSEPDQHVPRQHDPRHPEYRNGAARRAAQLFPPRRPRRADLRDARQHAGDARGRGGRERSGRTTRSIPPSSAWRATIGSSPTSRTARPAASAPRSCWATRGSGSSRRPSATT
jgi:hypothetical protein